MGTRFMIKSISRKWYDRVTVEEIRADFQARAAGQGWDGHVLAVQDTTELNFQHHAGKVRGLGAVGNGTDLGLFVHPVLALDADSPAVLNWADGWDCMVFKGQWAVVWRRPALPKGRPRWGRSGRW
jgi:hypothetical protein